MTTPYRVPVGYAWRIGVRLRDPATGAPLKLTGLTPWGDLYTGPGTAAQRIAASELILVQARFQLLVPKATTEGIAAGKLTDTVFPVHFQIGYTDAAENDYVLGPLYLLPLDPSAAG